MTVFDRTSIRQSASKVVLIQNQQLEVVRVVIACC